MAVGVIDCVSAGDRPAGPDVAQADRTADAYVDHVSNVCGVLFAADLFHRVQIARRRVGMERITPRGRAREWGPRRTARPYLRVGIFALQPEIHSGEPAKIRDLARGIRRRLEWRTVERKGDGGAEWRQF